MANTSLVEQGGGDIGKVTVKMHRLRVVDKNEVKVPATGPSTRIGNERSSSLDLDTIFSPSGGKHRKTLGDSLDSSSGISGGSSQNQMSVQSLPATTNASPSNLNLNDPATNSRQFVIQTTSHRPPPPSRGVRRYHSCIEMTDATNNRYRIGVIPEKSADGLFKKVKKHDEHLPTFLRGVGIGRSHSSSSKSSKTSKGSKKGGSKSEKKRNKPGRTRSAGLISLLGPPPTKDGKYYDAFAPPV